MISIIINGIGGKMGKKLFELATAPHNKTRYQVICGVDKFPPQNISVPVYHSLSDAPSAEVVIDFSRPDSLPDLIAYAKKHHAKIIIATTGFTQQEEEKITDLALSTAVLKASNTSLGMNLLFQLVQKAASVLKDYDIEIIEKHHNQKVDAPSGTALTLAEYANAGLQSPRSFKMGRSGKDPRTQNEIGIHAIRGGNICGDHDVMFISGDEIVTLSHHAENKDLFAKGALMAVDFIINKDSGLYSMQDVVSDLL